VKVEDWAREEPRVRYCSLHQDGIFPLTGRADDHGPLGNLLNVPLPAYTDGRDYLPAFEVRGSLLDPFFFTYLWRFGAVLLILALSSGQTKALPFLKSFEPDLLIVCAG
jgi:acetoin utilization deacetylase AcuC-like enzyme